MVWEGVWRSIGLLGTVVILNRSALVLRFRRRLPGAAQENIEMITQGKFGLA